MSPPTVSEETKQNDTSSSGHVSEGTNIHASVTNNNSIANDNSNTIIRHLYGMKRKTMKM